MTRAAQRLPWPERHVVTPLLRLPRPSPGPTCWPTPLPPQIRDPGCCAIAAAQGNVDLLRSQVFKVSHHASKHGINLELVERISSKLTLVSSVGGGGEFNFPHTVTQELIREALDPTTDNPRPHPADFKLGIFYTADQDPQGPSARSRWY